MRRQIISIFKLTAFLDGVPFLSRAPSCITMRLGLISIFLSLSGKDFAAILVLGAPQSTDFLTESGEYDHENSELHEKCGPQPTFQCKMHFGTSK